MDYSEYVIKSLSKIKHKSWELYVVSRIVHSLPSNGSIMFVCQQCVQRPQRLALTDIFFPQFELHVEIDEEHHSTPTQEKEDALRLRDIVNVTSHEVRRIKAYGGSLEEVNQQVDDLIEYILKKSRKIDLEPGKYENRYAVQPHRDHGGIDTKTGATFRYIKDVKQLWGYQGWHRQGSGAWNVPEEDGVEKCCVWFPKLYKNEHWDNQLSADGKTITERQIKEKYTRITDIDGSESKFPHRRYCFAHSRNELGATMYRFVGVFLLDVAKSNEAKYSVYQRVSTEVKLPQAAQ